MAKFDGSFPLLSALGRPTYMGPVGSGQVAKLANQLIVAITIGAVAEALHLAEMPVAIRQVSWRLLRAASPTAAFCICTETEW
ncbi:NAD-binding protein [Ensifer sesbaniae]|uniref:NAD-binding protein n=1 Tax=Ensifer sesbaniae TaxID=1214071 RepID=UPI0035E3C8A5